MMLTVFTPTYNRAGLLVRVYESLKKQKNYNFEWLIVDDGSSDNTEEVVSAFLNETSFSVRYIKKNNGGKHTAHNVAINEALGDWFMCLDSDDMLSENAVELIEQRISTVYEDDAGIICGKTDTLGNLLSDEIPILQTHYGFYRYAREYNAVGEYTLIFRTDIIKKYPYPVINGEHFAGENIVYDQMDMDGNVYAVLNETIQICEYQEDGLTSNIYKNLIQNPTGYQIYHMQRIDLVGTLKERLAHSIRYNAFRKMSKNKQYTYKGKHWFIVALTVLPGILGACGYKKKAKRI